MKITRRQLRQIITEEILALNESIDVRGVEVEWGKTANKKPAISLAGRLYNLSGPLDVPIEIEKMEYFEDPERIELEATADMPGPFDKKVIDSMKPKGINTIVKGVKSGDEEFDVPGRHGTVKFKMA